MKKFVLFLAMFVAAHANAATTHYVSTSGSDSSSGASESTPWAHVPGMHGATGSAASYAASAGDIFILRGCDVWYNPSFPIDLTHGGTAGSPVSITSDKSWYDTASCPSGWNRPVFDAHTSASSSTPMEINGSGGQATGCVSGDGNYFVVFTASYVTMSWIEMRNLYWANDAQNTCWAGNGWWRSNSVDYITVSNTYEHNWSMHPYSANTYGDVDIAVWVDGPPNCPHCLLDYNVADNCATTSGSGTLVGGSLDFVNVKHSIFKCMSNAIKPIFAGEIAYNEVTKNGESPDPTVHDNVLETVDAQGNGGVYYIHDNRFHDYWSGEGLQIGNPGETDYVWNNIWWGLLQVGANGPQVPQSETPVAMRFWNNIVVDWGDCINDASHGYSWSGAFYSQNNFCINSTGDATSGSPSASPVVISNNIGMTDSTASAAGYTSGTPLVYYPSSSSSLTVGKGANLSSLWPSGFSPLDSSITCMEQTVSGVVEAVCTGTPNARPASGAWDVGAYQYAGAVSSVAPAITSAIGTTFTVGVAGSFTVAASGTAPVAFLETGGLPSSVTLTSSGVLSGTPATGTTGSYIVTITASNGTLPNATQSFTLTVVAAPPPVTLSSIALTPAGASIVVGAAQQYTATGTYSNGTTKNLTGSSTWGSTNTVVATVTTSGLAAGVSAGTDIIQATSGSVTGSTSLTVTATPPPVTLTSISVTPVGASIISGATQQFTATGTYSNGTNKNITNSVTWSSTSTGVATITSSGLATGSVAGSDTVKATSGSVTGSAGLTVTSTPPPSGKVPYVLQPSVSSLSFTSVVGASSPASKSVVVSDSTPCPPPTGIAVCHWPVVVTSNQPWLSVTPSGGTTKFTLRVSASTKGLVTGEYSGKITFTVTPQGGQVLSNSPVSIPVTLTVSKERRQ